MWRVLRRPTSGRSTRRHPDYAPRAAFNLGVLLEKQGDVAGARAAYQRAIDSGKPDYALMAAVNLGMVLGKQGDVAGARAAYQRAIDSRAPRLRRRVVDG